MKDKTANASSTVPMYKDSSGKEFTVMDVFKGYRPKGKYKPYSLADRVTSPDFGKVTSK